MRRNLVQDLDAGQPDPDALDPDAACRGLLLWTPHAIISDSATLSDYTDSTVEPLAPMSAVCGPRPSCLGPRLFVWGWSAEPRYS